MMKDVVSAGSPDGRDDGRRIRQTRKVADADAVSSKKLEAEEILECTRQTLAPFARVNAGEIDSVDEDTAAGRFVHLRKQLHQRRLAGAVLADYRDDGSGRKQKIDVIQDEPIGPGIRKRQMLEPDAFLEA